MEAAVPHDNIALLAYFSDRVPELLGSRSRIPEVHAELEASYVQGAYLLDPFHELHVKRLPSGVYRLSDVAPDHFHRNKYFIDYYRQTTLIDELAFVAYPSQAVTLQLCLGRDRDSNRRFSTSEIKIAHAIGRLVASVLNRQWSHLSAVGAFGARDMREKFIHVVGESLGLSLTSREAEIVILIMQGHSSNSISHRLGIAYQTVKVFRRQIYRKCAISSQAELFGIFVPLLSSLNETKRI